MRNEPAFVANQLDVDRLHDILRQAEGGDTRALFALYRDVLLSDSHVQTEFAKRKLAVLGEAMSITPRDKKVPAEVEAAKFIEGFLDGIPGWLKACSHLLDSVLWPVAILEKVYRVEGGAYVLDRLVVVPDQLLDYSTGSLRIRDTDDAGNVLGTTHEPDRTRYIIHRGHLLTTADNWGGPMRSILFWWLLGNMDRDWWARFLDRYGSPFLVGRYDVGDNDSRSVLERAFSLATKLGGLVVTKQTSVELQQASTQSAGDAFEKFHAVSRREISKLILGQTLSADAQATGLGSGVAKEQGSVRNDFKQFDARMLSETLEDQLIKQGLKINGRAGVRVPRVSWGGESADEAKATGELLQNLSQAGLEVDDSGIETVSDRVGIPLRRASRPQAPVALPLTALSAASPLLVASHDATDAIARAGSAPLALAFRGSLAPIRRMIEESTSPEDLSRRILENYPDWQAGRVAALAEQALIAFAANGCARAARDVTTST
jgi:phage gp29-like protein